MKKALITVSCLTLLTIAFVGGFRFNQSAQNGGPRESGERKILHYVDPMNPANTSAEPGIAPCGMPMEPVYADEVDEGAAGGVPSGAVKLSESRQQLIGVQTSEVAETSETARLRVLGKVVPDENRTYALVSGADGWMGEIHDSTTGSIVRKGQLLGKIRLYDYDFYTWQQRYLTELGNAGRRRVYISPLSGMAKEVERAARARQEAGLLLPDPGAPIMIPSQNHAPMADEPDIHGPSGPPMENPHGARQHETKKEQPAPPPPPAAWGIPPGTLYYGEGSQPTGNPDEILTNTLREREKVPELPDGPAPEMVETPVADLPMEMTVAQPGAEAEMTGPRAADNPERQSPHMAPADNEEKSKNMVMEQAPATVEAAKVPMASHDHSSMSAPAPANGNNDGHSRMTSMSGQAKESERMPPTGKDRNPPHQKSGKHYFTGEDDILYASKARQELLDLGVTDAQLEELADTGVYVTSVQLRSPVDGLILSRSVTSSQKIDRGQECFRIADVDTIWVEAEVFDIEERLLPPGTVARVTLPNLGEYRLAEVTEVLPYFTADSRILKVRLEVENSDFRFRPEMFVDVEFLLQLEPALTVPASALIDSGTHAVVYVVSDEGIFEPREVRTGWRFNDRVEVRDGLAPGERIVVSGNFLIDSESRMKLAAFRLMDDEIHSTTSGSTSGRHEGRSMPAVMTHSAVADQRVVDPVCGMNIDPGTAAEKELKAEYDGKTYYFCSEECLEDFYRHGPKIDDAGSTSMDMPAMNGHHQPGNDSAAEMPVVDTSAEEQSIVRDPVCGMDVDIEQARAAGLNSEYQGQAYYFCSPYCLDMFAQSPLDYVDAQRPEGNSRHEGHTHD